MGRGRPVKSEIRQNIMEVLFFSLYIEKSVQNFCMDFSLNFIGGNFLIGDTVIDIKNG